jgi:2-polyprenyl-3-methyl-5-hydroxy-6-metoxy-1,4-benzoquinol methylase
MSSNKETLQTYEHHFQEYIDGTVKETSGFQKEWLEYLLALHTEDAAILEVGSAFGRDAAFMAQRGFHNLTTSDAFDVAVTTLLDRGFVAKKLNLLDDEIVGQYDLIIASAVFLHFTEPELRTVLLKIAPALTKNGALGFSVKNGTGEEWSSEKVGAPRFFHYWTEDTLLPVLTDCGYVVIDTRRTEDSKWLHITCEVSE